MSITYFDILAVGDNEQFVITGKRLKELLRIAQEVRSGPDLLHFKWGGELTRIVCDVTPINIRALLEGKGTRNGNT
jgi:hypothetical protein